MHAVFQSVHWTADVLTRCQFIKVNHFDFCEHPPCLSLPLQSASGSVLCPCLPLHNTLFSSGTYPAIRKTNRWHVFAGIWEHPHTQRKQLLRSTSMDKNMEEEGKLTMWNDALCFTSNPNCFCIMQGKISWPLDSVYNEVTYSVHSYRYLLFFSHTLDFKKSTPLHRLLLAAVRKMLPEAIMSLCISLLCCIPPPQQIYVVKRFCQLALKCIITLLLFEVNCD